ncbi:MAG: T9SS type A sorting domain-containing protein [Bacteroidales bacterium]|jgi:hypothetical protein|nr:T9SS type A sorting domain-containing protein [Bacteroidales bacterium]
MKKKLLILVLMAYSLASYAQFFDFDDVKFWVGNGDKKALLVVDFNDGSENECYVWGYKFDGTATASDMILAIDEADYHFNATMFGGFLNDITYMEHEGLGGNPHYWMTFTLENDSWVSNMGVSDELYDNMVFGMSYTGVDDNFDPLLEPEDPVAAEIPTAISKYNNIEITLYPNPAVDIVNINISTSVTDIEVYNSNGSLIYKVENINGLHAIDVSSWKSGVYIMKDNSNGSRIFIKE